MKEYHPNIVRVLDQGQVLSEGSQDSAAQEVSVNNNGSKIIIPSRNVTHRGKPAQDMKKAE